jgi:hypothetical protein
MSGLENPRLHFLKFSWPNLTCLSITLNPNTCKVSSFSAVFLWILKNGVAISNSTKISLQTVRNTFYELDKSQTLFYTNSNFKLGLYFSFTLPKQGVLKLLVLAYPQIKTVIFRVPPPPPNWTFTPLRTHIKIAPLSNGSFKRVFVRKIYYSHETSKVYPNCTPCILNHNKNGKFLILMRLITRVTIY